MLIVACRQAAALHSGVADTCRVDTQLTSLFVLQSLGSCDGAVLNRKSTGEATNNEVTNNVAVVIAILWTVADVRSQTHGMQQIHPAVIYVQIKIQIEIENRDKKFVLAQRKNHS